MNRKLIFVHASWCMPCKFLASHLITEISEVVPDQVQMLDADEFPSALDRMGLKGIPSVVLSEDGKVVRSYTGLYPSSETIIDWLQGKVETI